MGPKGDTVFVLYIVGVLVHNITKPRRRHDGGYTASTWENNFQGESWRSWDMTCMQLGGNDIDRLRSVSWHVTEGRVAASVYDEQTNE